MMQKFIIWLFPRRKATPSVEQRQILEEINRYEDRLIAAGIPVEVLAESDDDHLND